MEIRIIDEDQITSGLDREIKDGLCRCFPPDVEVFSKSRAWHGSSPAFTVIGLEAGKIVAHVGIVDRTIRVADVLIRVAGIQNVFVLPEWQKRSLSAEVMNSAMAEASRHGFDCGLLYCIPELEKVYCRCGWQRIADRDITRIDENNQELPIPGKNIAMFYPLQLTTFPDGAIHLCGNDW
jgi:nodulation protein A